MIIQKLEVHSPEPQSAALNVDVLKQLVDDQTTREADEKYGLNWHGKRRARQLALTPSTGTLRPCPEESVDWGSTQNLMIEGDNLEVLKLGLGLCVPIDPRSVTDKSVHGIGVGVLMAWRDTHIVVNEAEALALGIAEWRKQQAPASNTTCVFRDSAFENDVAKSNLVAILEPHGVKQVRSL